MVVTVADHRQILASQGAGGILEEVRARLLYGLAHTGGGISYYEFRTRDWDCRRRVETSGLIHQKDLDYDSTSRGHALDYLATDLWSFRAVVSILQRLSVRPAEYALVDYGCGKGRVLLMAIEAGFRKTIGVEIVPDLAQAAVDNLRSYRARRTASVHCGDATTFPVPAGPLVAFLFNPFTGPVLEAVAENIRRSFEEQPRAMYVLSHPRLPVPPRGALHSGRVGDESRDLPPRGLGPRKSHSSTSSRNLLAIVKEEPSSVADLEAILEDHREPVQGLFIIPALGSSAIAW